MPARASMQQEGSTVESTNEVRLIGRISQEPVERVLPSGDRVWTFRLVVGRGERARTRQSVDSIECAVWAARPRRSVSKRTVDDVVEVTGAIRRRFFRAGGATASRVEVEVEACRLIRRAGTS